jgi:tetratricopeptide (TPR) repeat protein
VPRSLCRAVGLLFLAACSRSPDPHPAGADAPARGAATRVVPPPRTTVIQPRPAPCLSSEPYAAPSALAEAARQALDDDQPARALACADEALRLAPRLTAALAARASALTAQGQLDEARLAFARALAVDPDDPRTLLDAADLYVRRLAGSRDALETALEYATRGARAALRAPRRDRALAAQLDLLAGMAENDLGRSHLALANLDRAVAALPQDADAVYERGVALFELCRFEDARKAFERTLALSPDDAWATHQLGLLAERRGDRRRANELLGRARKLSPADFPSELPVDERAFRAEVDVAVAALPAPEREALRLAPLEIRDLPAVEDLRAVDPPLSPSILGLYRGPADDEACAPADGPRCRSIVFYWKNLVRFAHTRDELRDQVRVTLLHELGHLHGETDEELRDRGLE